MPGIDTPFLGCLAAIRAPDAVWHGRYLPKFRKNERKYSEDSERKFVGNAENFLPDFTARRTWRQPCSWRCVLTYTYAICTLTCPCAMYVPRAGRVCERIMNEGPSRGKPSLCSLNAWNSRLKLASYRSVARKNYWYENVRAKGTLVECGGEGGSSSAGREIYVLVRSRWPGWLAPRRRERWATLFWNVPTLFQFYVATLTGCTLEKKEEKEYAYRTLFLHWHYRVCQIFVTDLQGCRIEICAA